MSLEKIFFENSVVHSCIFFYQAEAFNGCYDKLYTIKWFAFCLSSISRVIFKSRINSGTLSLLGGSELIYAGLFKHLAIAAYISTRLLKDTMKAYFC